MEVLDEPLCANFLRVTCLNRPYREELLSKESDGNKVIKNIIYGPGSRKYKFCKHIAKQRVPSLTDDLLNKEKHFILIRNPLDILPSFDKVVPRSFYELGLAELVCIYNDLCERGKPPPVVDAAELQEDPEQVRTQQMHEMKKKEEEYLKLQERLNQVLMEKKKGSRSGMETMNLLQKEGQQRGTGNGKKTDNDYYKKIVDAYEAKNQEHDGREC